MCRDCDVGGFSLESIKAGHIYCLKWPMKRMNWILFSQKSVFLLA